MWTEITRPKYGREGLRYASDTTDAEWAVIMPLLPEPATGRGRPRTTDGLRNGACALIGFRLVGGDIERLLAQALDETAADG